jgi:hypothetical protein
MDSPNFLIDTVTVPTDVDPFLGQRRNRIIERGRQLPERREFILGALASLYWDHEEVVSDETRLYLVDALTDYAIEADIDTNRAYEIWHAVRED